MQGGIDWTQISISEIDRKAILQEVNKKSGYEFISLLGKSNSQIFKVKKSEKQFAAKLVKIETTEDDDKTEFDKKFKQGIGEIEIMMKAKEKGFNNAVKIEKHYEVPVTPKRKYLIIIMQILQKILANELTKIMNVGHEFSKRVCFKIAQAVYLMHKTTNIIHRDIKLENIAIETDYKGQVLIKLLDFGLSKMCENNRQTRTLIGRGTLDYIAPQLRPDLLDDQQGEQLKYDYTVDYWALGIVMIEVAFGNKISKLKIDLKKKFKTIQDIAKMIQDEELRQLILILISIKSENRRKADQIIVQKLKQSKGVQADKFFQKLLGQNEYKRLSRTSRTQKKEPIKSEPMPLIKPTLFYVQVQKIDFKQVHETKQMVVQTLKIVQKLIPITTYKTQILLVEKLVEKVIEIDEDKDQPIIVQYIEEIPDIIQKVYEEWFQYFVLEEVSVPVEIEKIQIFQKRTKIEVPNFIVDDQKAEKTVYPVQLTKQSVKVIKIEMEEIVQCVTVKERAIQIERMVQDIEEVQLIKQMPVLISKKTGKRVGLPKGAVMKKKQVRKLIEKQIKKRVPKIQEMKIEKYVELTKVSYLDVEVVQTQVVDIFISKADAAKMQ